MILRRSSAAACRPKSARRVRVGGERRVSLARLRDVGTQHRKNTPSASDKRGWGVGEVHASTMSGRGPAASGAGNRWAAIAAAVRWAGASVAGACGRWPKPVPEVRDLL